MGLHLPQRHRTPPRLKVVRSGQGRHRLKMIFRFDKVGMVSPPLSVKIRNRYWLHQILGASEVRFSAISTVFSIAGVVNMEAHQLPAPCTFSSTVLASSWAPCTFSSTVLAPSWVLLLPELQACKSIEEWFSWTPFQNCYIPPLFSVHSLVSFLFPYVVSFQHKLIQALSFYVVLLSLS